MCTAVVIRATTVAVLAAATGASCGGIAVVDGMGTGGSTSTSSGTGGTTSSGSTSTSASSGAGAGPGFLCDEACASIAPCLSVGVSCVYNCESAYDSCVGYNNAYLECVIQSIEPLGCGPLPECADELGEFLSCKNILAAGGGCAVSPNGDCECQVEDNQGNMYESFCFSSEGSNKCECAFHGQPVGQCSYTGPSDCDPLNNCCAALFFVPALPG